MAGLLGHVDLCTSLLEERGACLLPRNSSGSHRPLASLLQKMVKAEDALLYADVGVSGIFGLSFAFAPKTFGRVLLKEEPHKSRDGMANHLGNSLLCGIPVNVLGIRDVKEKSVKKKMLVARGVQHGVHACLQMAQINNGIIRNDALGYLSFSVSALLSTAELYVGLKKD